MARRLFYRNVQAAGHLDAFLLAAVASVLGVRFYLQATGFPQIGSGGLHIAHMLWGGFLMMAAIIMLVSFLGTRIQRVAAIVGGLGFGVFIDELGKFITSDNNYFFRPTIGFIYAIFIILYLVFNYLTRDKQRLSSREYQLNALLHIQEAILHDMDPSEKHRAQQLIARAQQRNYITRSLQDLLHQVDTVPRRNPSIFERTLRKLDRGYTRFWRASRSTWRVRVFFILEALVFMAGAVFAAWDNISDVKGLLSGSYSYPRVLLLAELVSAAMAAMIVLAGVVVLARSRMRAFELFRQAALINIFLTQFFVFSREELRALPGFVLNMGVLLLVTYGMHQELRLRKRAGDERGD